MKTNERSGRTSRLIEHAKELASKGRAVYVVAHNADHAELLRQKMGTVSLGFKNGSGIRVEPCDSVNFEWSTLSIIGAHPKCAFLVDHYTIEQRFAHVLEMLNQYNKE